VPTRWSLNEAGSAAANLWLIFIDDLHLDFRATGHLKDLFKQITDALVREGDLFAIVSTGPSSIAIDLTRDRGRLTQAVGQITGAALKPSDILQPVTNQEVRYRAHVTFSTAYSVMKMLALAPNKRKAFIYISNGYYFDLWPGASSSSRENPFLAGGNEYGLERLRAEVAELTRQAARSNVTIFGIDPRALSGPPTIEPSMKDAAWQEYWTTTRKSLQVISEETGGHVIQDDVDENLKQIASAVR
jgi:VWFA-related protein